MNLKEQRLALCAVISLSLGGFVSGEERLLHRGLPVSIPDSTILSPFAENRPTEELKQLKFEREFFIDSEAFESLPAPSSEYGEVAVSAIEAIEISKKNVDPNSTLQSFVVTAVQLLKSPRQNNREIEYYLVSMLANGSEEHRIVLMNRAIISPKLKRLKQ